MEKALREAAEDHNLTFASLDYDPEANNLPWHTWIFAASRHEGRRRVGHRIDYVNRP